MAQGESSAFRNASPTGRHLARRHAAARVFQRVPRIARKIAHLGELADFVDFQERTLGGGPLHQTREQLWSSIVARVDEPGLTVVELGVAWGYATDWWLSRLHKSDVIWHGFDTFTGLPDAFRDLPPGHFSSQGAPPPLPDSRIRWHAGLVEDTLPAVDLQARTGRLLVLFDLDLYAPSRFAWLHLKPWLRRGDVLYFDEAYDASERRLLIEDVLPSVTYRFLGGTTTGVAIQLT